MVEEQKKDASQALKIMMKVITGVALLIVGALLIWLWRWEVLTLIKGCLGLVVILAGIIFLAIAKE